MSVPRMHDYLVACGRDSRSALDLYRWNTHISAAFWETLSYAEIAFRNAMAERLAQRHQRLQRRGTWLDDPACELDVRAREDICKARKRVRQKKKAPSDGQTIAELTFGFWRFLLAKQYATNLWPDLAAAFPGAQRNRARVEQPVSELHEFRNRLAHHEPTWNKDLRARLHDLEILLTYLDPGLQHRVTSSCRVRAALTTCPVTRPYR
ncbi:MULTISPECIES: Abi family protein [unclassified Crossiella]|uniref:Abi family protein n=1 Tax=unclassified Crossiella TaxID=2620835 RepID=UPI001FFF7613|nr:MULTISPECIES: Abi family protein [unclassified Crossiella]MCK2245446.1 Abi family protein [Crossiella sp. S99.2]MCK2259098.1 Abi family protein [Crossiella sp. S99.1]